MATALKQGPSDFPSFTTTSDTYAHNLYTDAFKKHEIDAFLGETCTYDTIQSKWSIPAVPMTSENLVNSFYSVISSIVGRFVRSAEPGVDRVLESTLGIPECDPYNGKGYRSYPALVLQATGPSFQIPEPIQSRTLASPLPAGYSQVATFFSVKLDSEVFSEAREVEEMEAYARRVLRTQPNRFYVQCISLTQKYARLIHFDRAGAEITPPIDFHQHPSTLIRLIAGLSSTDERLLGIDTSIQWSILNGRKDKGTLTTTGANGKPKVYPILDQLPTPLDSIYGRATTCWRVQDPDTLEKLVVKDSWRPDNRPGEYEFLEAVKGVPGVVQMVSHETRRGETKNFRCPTTGGRYRNRVATRVVLKSYGPPIEYFTSMLQMLYAIRDAIAGHRNLVSDGIQILHRDVAAQNVLLGGRNSLPGTRGILIDLDLAFMATDTTPATKVDYNIGLRAFQSLSVLGSLYYEDTAPAHDYLDDLESFFYLLVYLFLLYRPDGSRFLATDEGPSIVLTWTEDDAGVAYVNKERFLGIRGQFQANRLIQMFWGPVCADLFNTFRAWIVDTRDEKDMLLHQGNNLTTFLGQRNEHYAEVLAMFDKAIEAIAPPPAPQPEGPDTASIPVLGGQLPGPVHDVLPPPGMPSAPTSTPCSAAQPCTPAIVADPPEFPQPTIVPTPITPIPTRPLRRSIRIRQLEKTTDPSIPARVPPLSRCMPPIPVQVIPQPRRSDRIRKRCHEEDWHTEPPQPKARRMSKRPRVANHSR